MTGSRHGSTGNTALAHAQEVQSGSRFDFGRNWTKFLGVLDEGRLDEACRSLKSMLGEAEIADRSWLDAGSGSGLFSLAAIRLGASRVFSVDFDSQSVACTQELRSRYRVPHERWTVEQGSILDAEYIHSLGHFDVVYSWGVVHHTGKMWRAIDLLTDTVAPGGRLFIAIYNDQGPASHRWRRIKRRYNSLPALLRPPYVIAVMGPREARMAAAAVLHRDFGSYIQLWTRYRRNRGMSRWHDLVDWVGGYPYEFATAATATEFLEKRGFVLRQLVANDGWGCNQFVFERLTS